MDDPKLSKAVLDSLPIAAVLEWRATHTPHKPLVFATTATTLGDAMDLLTVNRVLSVPVWSDDDNAFVEFVTFLDILQFCLPRKELSPMRTPLSEVLQAVGKDCKTAMEIMPFDECVGELMESFSLSVHRVLINDPNGPASGPAGFVLSQSDLLRYLQANPNGTSAITSATLEECGLVGSRHAGTGPGALVCVKESSGVVDAFTKLSNDRTSAVAVVNEEGKLVENLSASDLRGLAERDLDSYMALSVAAFLHRRHGRQRTPVTCARSSTLKQAIDSLALNRVHRLWVVDTHGKLEGVVALTDVLAKFAPFDYKKLNPDKV